MYPAIVFGIVTGHAQLFAYNFPLSPGTEEEAFANVSLAKFPSRF